MYRVINVVGDNVVVRQKLPDGYKRVKGPTGRTEIVHKSGFILKAGDSNAGTSNEVFEGIVVAVGDLVQLLKKGDLVSFAKHSFSSKYWGSEEYLILRSNYFVAVESEPKTKPKKLKSSEFIAGETNDID